METFEAGDIITFRLHGDDYGLAHVLNVQQLTSYRYYHLAILDQVLEAVEGGVDSYGVMNERAQTFGPEENVPMVIDHVALTHEAFAESTPAKVDFREVTDEEMEGFQLWLITAREQLVKQGRIPDQRRAEPEEEPEDEYDEEYDEEMEEAEGDELMDPADLDAADVPESVEEELDHLEREEGEESLYRELVPEGGSHTEGDEKNDGAGETIRIELRSWHRQIFDRPLGEVLFALRDDLAGEDLAGTRLAAYVSGFFERAGEAINELIVRFVDEGDYGAGHELIVFGDAAADALAARLQDGMDTQAAEDITNILCEMGTLRAYEHIARFFLQHEGNLDDPLNYAAARGFSYAVMLTGGTPAPLKEHLARLEDITNPELAHDVQAARDAVQAASQLEEPGDQVAPGASTDPFARL